RPVCLVTLVGKLDSVAVAEVESRVDALYEQGYRQFVFDLTRLTYVGSMGLRVFVALSNRVRWAGGVAVCALTPAIGGIFDLTKVTQLVKIYPTRREAIDAARSS